MKQYLAKFLPAVALVLSACDNTTAPSTEAGKRDSVNKISDSTSGSMPADSLMYDQSFGKEETSLPGNMQVPPPTTEVEVVIHQLVGYGEDEGFARATSDSLKTVLNSAGFKRAVLNTSFDYHNRGLSAQQIYDLIMQAHEEDGPGGSDGVLDLRLRIITLAEDGQRWINACNRSTIGIDGSGTGISAVCPRWLRSTAQNTHHSWLAAHFIHEYMHLLNFRHPDHKPQSVPYKIHALVEELIENPTLRK